MISLIVAASGGVSEIGPLRSLNGVLAIVRAALEHVAPLPIQDSQVVGFVIL